MRDFSMIKRIGSCTIVLFALALGACDDGINVSRDYPSKLIDAKYLKGLPAHIPVHLDGFDSDARTAVSKNLQTIATALSVNTPVRFTIGQIPDGRAFALRITLQPSDDFSGLSLCQGRSIAYKTIANRESKQRTRTVIAALCDNRRRLGEVRAFQTPKPGTEPPSDIAIAEAAIRKLFALPAAK